MRISDWSSDVCSSDLVDEPAAGDGDRRDQDRPEFRSWAAQRSGRGRDRALVDHAEPRTQARRHRRRNRDRGATVGLAQARLSLRTGLPIFKGAVVRSEEHTSELQSIMRISYAVFSLKNQTSI